MLKESLAQAVLDDRLVQGLVKLRMHDVPCTVIQETDHICRFPINVNAVFDIRLPEIIPPGLLKAPCTGNILCIGTHLPARIAARGKLVLEGALPQEAGLCQSLPLKYAYDLDNTAFWHFPPKTDRFFDQILRDLACS